MGFADYYLHRFSTPDLLIAERPQNDLHYIVVIPCFNEPDIFRALYALNNTVPPRKAVEIIVIINAPENAPGKIHLLNRQVYEQIKTTAKKQEFTYKVFPLLFNDLPSKHAGAGLARKIGMDEAIRRFNQIHNDTGIILSFDADATCDPDYFTITENRFSAKGLRGCTYYFEHPIEGNDYPADTYQAMTWYELYLRYYLQALRYTGYPYAFHTVGSCFAVTALTYVLQGGMNKKKAGEDFYFLQKVTPLGQFSEINTTCIYPSSRPSDRVPFGTGPMISKIVQSKGLKTYHLEAFEDIRKLFDLIPGFFRTDKRMWHSIHNSLPLGIQAFLSQEKWINTIEEISRNSTTEKSFTKRFFQWFNVFRILKYLNFSHEEVYKLTHIEIPAATLYQKVTKMPVSGLTAKGILLKYREWEKSREYTV